MPNLIGTFGDVGQDREIDGILSRITILEKAGSIASPAVTIPTNAFTSQLAGINVDVVGGTAYFGTTIEFEPTEFGVTAPVNIPRVSRNVCATTPSDIAAAAVVGTSVQSANRDHTHKGVLSINGLFGAPSVVAGLNIASIGVAGSSITINGADVSVVGADPGSPRTGQLWYRSDLNQLSIYTGAATKRSAVFT